MIKYLRLTRLALLAFVALASVPASAGGTQATYHGGPLIPNVKVIQVDWTGGVNSQINSQMPLFYTAFTHSTMFNWLSEYNATDSTGTSYSIGSGSFDGNGPYVIYPFNATGKTLTAQQIQDELTSHIQYGYLPPPTANTLYMIHFPVGYTITYGWIFGLGSHTTDCTQANGVCGFHLSFFDPSLGPPVNYAVLPSLEPGSKCDGWCGTANWLDNQTSVASHEIIEAVTDPEQYPYNAWYAEPTSGDFEEIGDLCNRQHDHFTDSSGASWTVQTEWSNNAQGCIASRKFTVAPSTGNTFSPSFWANEQLADSSHVLTGDFNGDGKTDIVTITPPNSTTPQTTDLNVGLSNGTGFTTSSWAATDTTKNTVFLTGDFNGDGATDILMVDVAGSSPASSDIEVALSNAKNPGSPSDTFTVSTWATWSASTATIFRTGDFDGDGMTDLMKVAVSGSSYQTAGVYVGLSDGTSFPRTSTSAWTSWTASTLTRVLTGDFNGDGATDLMKVDVAGSTSQPVEIHVALSNAKAPATPNSTSPSDTFTNVYVANWHASTTTKFLVGDFNGDKRLFSDGNYYPVDDLLKFDVNSTYEQHGLYVGIPNDPADITSLVSSKWALLDGSSQTRLLAGDFNGDGVTDVIKFDVTGSAYAINHLTVGLSWQRSPLGPCGYHTGTCDHFETAVWQDMTTSTRMKVATGHFDGQLSSFGHPLEGILKGDVW